MAGIPGGENCRFLAVTAVGRDRPGIVAEFSGAVYRVGGNLEDATMTRLRSEFAMLLLVRVETARLEEMEAAVREAARRTGLDVLCRRLDAGEAKLPAPAGGSGYILRVYGADRPGIVHRFTTLLAERGLNISDLNTRVLGAAGGSPVYVMVLEIDSVSPEHAEALRPELERLSRELEVEIGFEPLEAEIL